MPSLGPLPSPLPFTEPFVGSLKKAAPFNHQDDPNWYAHDPQCLISESAVNSFVTGTGDAIYRSLAPLLEATNHELILVTCFWARSSSLDSLNALLRKLSEKAISRGTGKIKVRLCFSSSSLFQKLFHTQSTQGQTYPSSSWTKQFGLPEPSELEGLDLRISSIFILPFSVMHPKFILIDRRSVVLPSCNISWEEWFEGAITFSGPIVENFFQFYKRFWCRMDVQSLPTSTIHSDYPSPQHVNTAAPQDLRDIVPHGHTITPISTTSSTIPTIFLPSPHRRNPNFHPFASSSAISAPPTPLNVFVLNLLAQAARTIRIQSPNLTSPPVLSAILKSLGRGVDVQILTSERLMILEQLVTAGTTTSRCVKTLIKRYKKLARAEAAHLATDEEAALSAPRMGVLKILYFEPLHGSKPRGKEEGEPQQSHLKMMIVDGEVVVLGSGNLDRASWFTSQELGVAFFDKGLVGQVEEAVDRGMKGRAKLVFDGSRLVERPKQWTCMATSRNRSS
ncbi:phospholipase D/nuclease [Paraphaeosphaeria sporulosa]|uniref:Phospholipase D/nuclease n=1 Tax=Paraphaeosphaeria sporulosa TaxID=1460663 RepID=A0A177CFB4_9PLEO|nr:phospholipase D/nuclease [Paraphaeosphaeria sporulosa]OAG06304.1 phospholipase D/nuclease [Paraphaeosphaeria sporulosa]